MSRSGFSQFKEWVFIGVIGFCGSAGWGIYGSVNELNTKIAVLIQSQMSLKESHDKLEARVDRIEERK